MSLKNISDLFLRKKSFDWEYYYNYCKGISEKDYPECLKEIYKIKMGKNLNLDNPKTFTEKIQWLKLYDNLPIKGILSDKLGVRDWVESKIGSGYLPELYGVWDSFDEIKFETLPETFILKATHGSRMNITVFSKESFLKANVEEARQLFKRWMVTNFAFACGLELQYLTISPKIIAEERIITSKGRHIVDSLFHCFNGKPMFVEHLVPIVGHPEQVSYLFHDISWNKLSINNTFNPSFEKPKYFDEMSELAKILSQGFKYVRVDFRESEDNLYFGEMTFTPISGYMEFRPQKYDKIFGDMIDIGI